MSLSSILKPRLLIAGGGALGLYFASQFTSPYMVCHHEQEVKIVDKFATDLTKCVNAGHLKVQNTSDGSITSHPTLSVGTYADLNQNDKYDAVLLAVKNMYVKDVMSECHKYLKNDGIVFSLLNGMGVVEVISEHVPRDRILLGVTLTAVTPDPAACLLKAGPGATPVYAAQGEPSANMLALYDAIHKTCPFIELDKNLWKRIWSKMVINCSFNCISALTKLNLAGIAENSTGATLLNQIACEVASVARANGVPLSNDEAMSLVNKNNEALGMMMMYCRCHGVVSIRHHRTSMLQDILANRRTEVDYLAGYIVQQGIKFNIPVPVTETLFRLIKLYEASLGFDLPKSDFTSCPLANFCELRESCVNCSHEHCPIKQ